MPLYEPDHVEYEVTSGHIQIAMEDGTILPAYWAHPTIGAKFPGVALIHDWWGVMPLVRRMAMLFAQAGHYVIVPDLFGGQVAGTASEALKLFDSLGTSGNARVDTVLAALETHHNCNGDVAAVGMGMGGSLVFEAAILRADLEAAVAFGGFPQRFMGHFKRSNTPILAFYGENDPYVSADVITQFRSELAACTIQPPHEVVVLDGVGHDIFTDNLPDQHHDAGRTAWHKMLDFLDDLLEGPNQPPEKKRY